MLATPINKNAKQRMVDTTKTDISNGKAELRHKPKHLLKFVQLKNKQKPFLFFILEEFKQIVFNPMQNLLLAAIYSALIQQAEAYGKALQLNFPLKIYPLTIL